MIRSLSPKTKTCPVCEFNFHPRTSLQKYCSPTCELKLKTGKAEFEDMTKLSLQKCKEMARGVFQQFIKLRDKGKGCITGNHEFKPSDQIQAGHVFSAEKYPGLIFHEDNCHSQCSFHNANMNRDEIDLATKTEVMKRIGMERWHDLSTLKDQQVVRNYKYSKPELIDEYNTYKQKISEWK